jgi:chaperone required for assembly of F1-ATPase
MGPNRPNWMIWAALAVVVVLGVSAAEQGSDQRISVAQTSTSAPTSNTAQQQQTPDQDLSNNNTYVNVDGRTVHSPAYSTDGSVPAGATAQCADGTFSFSQHRRGTCSYHGGVGHWL